MCKKNTKLSAVLVVGSASCLSGNRSTPMMQDYTVIIARGLNQLGLTKVACRCTTLDRSSIVGTGGNRIGRIVTGCRDGVELFRCKDGMIETYQLRYKPSTS